VPRMIAYRPYLLQIVARRIPACNRAHPLTRPLAIASFSTLTVSRDRLWSDIHHTCQWGQGERWGKSVTFLIIPFDCLRSHYTVFLFLRPQPISYRMAPKSLTASAEARQMLACRGCLCQTRTSLLVIGSWRPQSR